MVVSNLQRMLIIFHIYRHSCSGTYCICELVWDALQYAGMVCILVHHGGVWVHVN